MANDTQTPELTKEDIAALLELLRKSERPMTTDELVAALRKSTSNS